MEAKQCATTDNRSVKKTKWKSKRIQRKMKTKQTKNDKPKAMGHWKKQL